MRSTIFRRQRGVDTIRTKGGQPSGFGRFVAKAVDRILAGRDWLASFIASPQSFFGSNKTSRPNRIKGKWRLSSMLKMICEQFQKSELSKAKHQRRNVFRRSLGGNMELLEGRAMMAVYSMSSGDKTWDFSDVASWTASTGAGQISYAGATNATYWAGLPINSSGTIAAGTRVSNASQAFVSGATGGVQKGTQALQFLSTGSGATPNSTAVDLQLNFSGRNAGTLSFDWTAIDNSSGTRPTSLRVFYSTDNINFTELTAAATLERESATSPASGSISAIALPSAFNNSATATLRFFNFAGSNAVGGGNRDKLQIDNVAVTSTPIGPTITGSATATAFTTTYGTASAVQTFSITGSNLTANITASAPTGFEVSSDGTTYSTTATFTQSGGTASGTLSLRLAATASVGGTYNSQTVTLASTGATTVNITTASTGNAVSPKALTITGLSVTPKTYNGNNSATLSGTAAYSGLANSESFSVTGTPAATFNNANVGNGKAVTVTGYTAPSANYTVTQPSLTGNITAAPLTVTANNVTKVQGTTLTGGAGSTAFTSSGLVNSETIGSVTISYGSGAAPGDTAGTYAGSIVASAATGGSFSDSNYGITYVAGDIVVSASPTISTSGTLAPVNTTYGSASPTPSSFTVSGGFLTGDLMVTAPAGFEISTTLGGSYTTWVALTQSGGAVPITTIYVRLNSTSFVGTYSGNLLVSGGDATPVDVPTAASTVSPKTLTIGGLVATSKAYDGTNAANVSGTVSYVGLVNGDTFAAPTVGTWTYANKNVGNGKTLTRSATYADPSANYTVTQPSLTADISAAALTISGAAVTTKVYDATTAATITGTLAGVISPDVVGFTGGGTFASANAGTAIAVTAALTLTGADSGNYTLTQPTGLTGDITKVDQSITFGTLPAKLTTDSPFTLSATASSGLTVAYSSSNPSVATVSGNTVTIVGAGSVTITAAQTGNTNYNAASEVQQSFSVLAPTVLAAGDIAVIGFVTNGSPDSFTIVILKDLTPGTSFFVNDNEIATAGGSAFTELNEVEASFTVKAGQIISAGTVITLPWGQAAVSTSTYDWSSTSSAGFGNPSNDEIYIYTAPTIASATATTFIYGAALGTSTSARPAGLTTGTTFINPTGTNFARYKTSGATYTSTQSALLSHIGNTASNWEAVTPGATTDWTFNVVSNTAPTNLEISAQSVAENTASGSTVGTFASTDANAGDIFMYSLVSGSGSTDNASFTIDNAGGVGTLKTGAIFNFETKSSYEIRVRSTDAGGLMFEKTFTISVNDVNEAPTDIAITSTSVAENAGAGATVGTLSTTDPDAVNTFTYTLVSGAGSTDNSAFTITGSTLTANAGFDFETKNSYAVRVRSTDQGGLFFDKTFTIGVTNVNEVPTDIALSSATIAENAGANTTVGNLSTVDPDAANTFTYTLVSGTGDNDNAAFAITGASLTANAGFDFETKSSYTVRVRSTDQGGLSTEKVFVITVTNANEGPTDIALSNTSIAENAGASATVGTLSTVDPDAANTFTYTLVSGTGADDNAAFAITGSTLTANASFDFEAKSSFSVRVRSTDQGGLSAEKSFVITVTNANESPTDIALSNASIVENVGSNATVGTLSTVDPDAANTFTYTLVSGTGADDNAAFSISGSTLTATPSFDFETQSSYTVRVRSTDQGGLSTEKSFVISVANANEGPTDIALSNASIAENAGASATVGTLSTVDPDTASTFAYSLVSGTGSDDNAAFSISGSTLTANSGFDFETKNSYTVRIRSTDQGGLSTEKAFTIGVTNANETPVFGAASYTFSVAENSTSPTAVGSVNATDVDAGTTLTYSLTGTGSSNFAINPSTGAITVAAGATLDFDTTPSYSLTVSASDGSLSATAPVTINLTNVNETPVFGAASYSFSIAENSVAATAVGSVSATDPDAATTLTYSFSGAGSSNFAISASGAITVAAGATLDFETTPSYSLTVTASDGTLSATAPVTISLTNVNEAPVFGAASYSFSLAENSTVATAVGSVSATDPDAATTLVYSLSGTGSSNFAISATGAITVAAGATLDFETTSSYSLTVTASDGTLSATAPVTVGLTNVNEAPVFGAASYSFSIAENSAAATAVGSVSATDLDAATTLTYSLSGTGSSNFSISSTGAIAVAAGAALNFEATPSYSLTVTASDGALSATAPVTINLTNVNEAPTDIAISNSTIAENAGINATIGTLSTVDVDAGATFTYTLVSGTGGDDNSAFTISGSTLTANSSFDFDAKSSYTVRIRSTDQGGLFTEKAFTISVTNVNEAPTFGAASYTFSIAENSASTTAVGTVSASDPDAGATLTYSLSGTGSSNFAINSTTGAITVAAGATLDFETTPSYSLTVTASDGSLSATAPVTISLTNVNEAPSFGAASYSFSIAENSATATSVGSVSATDPDAATTLVYSLSGAGSSNFAISASGAITVAAGAALNFETTPSFSLTVTASDGTLSATAPVTINLTNVNEAPTDIALSNASIAENAGSNATVGTLSTTDVDAGDTFTYSLVSGTGSDDNSAFTISGSTLTANSSFDFDTKSSYTVRIRSTDQGSLFTEKAFVITVTNANEPPVFGAASYTFSIAENSVSTTAVGTISATDPDVGATLTYSLSGTGSSNFAISSTGAISVASGATLDFEATPSYSLTVTASDGTLSATAPVTINLTNVNETPVFGAASYSFSIAENSAATVSVGSVSATDPDAATTIVYSLSGTGSNNFAISATGAISVAAGATLDFETTPSYSLTVTASDGTLSATAPVTISLTNVNEAPSFGAASYSFSVAENSGAATAVGSVSATDPDAATTLVYSLSGTGSNNFAISATGAISVAAGATLDFETTPSYSLTVTASDGTLSATAPVTISLTNVNEAPSFGAASYTYSIAENSAAATSVGSVSATDPDAATTLVYSLSGTGASNFAISATGAITVAAGATLNFEATPSYSLTVTASDGTLSATAPVTINLTNVNEAPTDIALSNSTIAENAGSNATVGTLSTVDVDAGDTFTYSLVSGTGGDDNAAFTISGSTLTANSSFDFDAKSSYTVRIRTTDQGSLFTEKAFVITVTNANEAPVFGAPSYTFSIAENSVSTTAVGTISATDPDAGATLTYSLSGTGSSNFAINASTGAITVAAGATLDFETTPSYSLTVSVSDGSLSATAPVTINLTNVNEAPLFGAASYTFSLAENSAATTAAGSVSATDPDVGANLNYSLSGTGSSNFAINSTTGAITVAAGATLNFETTPSYGLTVSVSDGGLSATAPVTINLTNVNEAPTDIALSNATIAENAGANAAVGTLSTTDVDAGNTFTYTLVSGTGSDDNAAFTVSGSTLRANASFDFETKNSYTVRVRSTDQGGLSTEKAFTISVTDVGENFSPTDIALLNASIAENAAANATVGTFSTTDSNGGDTFIYSLVSGSGSTDNAAFNISGSILRANASFDFETKSSYTVRVRSTDQGGLFTEKAFTIGVTNVNEAPVFGQGSYTFAVAENSLASTAVGTAAATDPEAAPTLVYSLSGTGSSNFAISSTGAITVAAGATLNFETTPSYSLIVTASDGTLSGAASVTVSLTNVNETPVFGAASYSFSVAENAATATAVGSVSATDPDAATTLTYSLTGTGSSNFAISSTGAITVAAGAALDFDTTSSYSLTVSVSDGTLSATAPVTINITNANEAPVFGAASYVFSVAENSATSTEVGSVSATDPDAGATLTYSLSGTGSTNFAISSTGAITVAAGATLDFETTPSYSLTVSVSDGSLSATAPVTINLMNVNESPVFGAASYSFSIAENSAAATAVGSVSATDPDAATTLTYSLSGTGSSNFAISATGAITVAAGATLNFETTPSYSLTVMASDGSLSATAPVTINLTNVNESPVFGAASYSFSISENSAAATAVGSVSATDPDAATTLTYSLSGTGSSNFAISATGAITVAAGATLNFETTPSYSLTVTASDGTLSATAPVTISLTNVNEAPVFGAASYSFSIAENSTATTAVGSVSATDPEAAPTLVYSLSGIGSSNFVISATGAITVAAGATLDFEATPSYSLTVTASDGVLSGTAPVTVSLTNVNETPVFNAASYSFSVAENAATATAVGSVGATDPDAANTLTYSLTGTGSSNFAINPTTGAITVTSGASLDFDTTPSYSLTVSVSDGSLSATAPVTINVTNANEAPVFGAASYAFSVAENSATSTAVGSVSATDPDAGTTLTYSLSGTGSSNFAISSTGVITVATGATLDFETTSSYSLTVSVSDGSLSATAPVTINLTNVNEAPTNIALSNASIAENAGSNVTIGTLSTTDVDAGNTFAYSLVSGTGSTDNAAFTISGETLSANASFDFETKSSYAVRVRSTDQGGLSTEKTFVISVTNVNEAPTDIALSNASVPENAGSDATVGTLSTVDTDGGGTFTYALVSGTGADDNAAFNISGSTLRANASFDFETKSNYTVRVRSTDQGGFTTEKAFAVAVTNVNEAPVLGQPSYVYTIAENASTGTIVGTPTASDPDAGAVITFSLSGTGSSNFTISPTTGAISVAAGAGLDFETTPTYTLTVSASDGSLAGSAPVTINLTDANDAPVFGSASYSFSVPENSAAGTSIGSVVATDADAGSTLAYSLSGTGAGQFTINSLTGAIAVAVGANLDFETTPTYVLTASVTDGTLTTTVPVTISLTDVNDQPSISPQAFTLAENSANGSTVGTVAAFAANSYAITAGNTSGAFSIDANSGVLTVANVSALNFEVTPTFSLTVTITAVGGVTASNTVTVNLTNVNEGPMLLEQSLVVNENAANGTVIGSVTATDPDTNDVLTFTITGGNPDGALAMNSNGQLTVADSTKLNYEVTPVIALTVTVTDAAGLTSTNTVSVLLNDLNESPVVTASLLTIAENSATGTFIGSASATDPDQGQTLTYRFSNGQSTSGPLQIDATTGEIRVLSSLFLNYESYNNSVYTIQAVDNGSPIRSGSVQVTLTLIDVNEAPIFTSSSYTFDLLENEPAGTAVGTARAFDQDAGSTVTHSLSGTGSSNFSINSATGAITVAAGADFDAIATPVYNLTVLATDGTFNVSAPVTINVRNFNYFPVINSQSFSVPENSAVGTVVGTVVATDRDSEQTLTYAITAGNSTGAFAINSSTGQITVANSAPLDRETQFSFSLTVTVSDSGDPSLSASGSVFISLTNVNEAPTIAPQTFTVEEGAPNGATVGFIFASDVDAGDSKTFAIVSGNSLGAFALNTSTGRLTIADTSKLEFDVNPTFALVVSVTDGGGLSASNTMTINLTNVDYPPTINAQSFTIPENLVNGSSVGVVSASDRDQFDTKTFAITADPSGAFSINPSTGRISVADFTKLNYESSSVLPIAVTVTDSTNLSASAAITITLTDVNEVPSPGAPSFAFTVSENSLAGSAVGTVTATDPDAGSTLSYSLSGTGSSNFAVNASTGVITVAAGATLDFETTPSYSLAVQISDGELSATAPVIVTLTNVNDAPVVQTSAGAAAFDGSAVVVIDGGVTVSDADSATLASATVSISNGFVSGEDVLGFSNGSGITGAYNATTGVLTLSGTATAATYQAALRTVTYANSNATASGSPNTATRTVSFQVNDGGSADNLSNIATRIVTVSNTANLPLYIQSVTPTSTGFVVQFNRPVDPARINLYDATNDSLGVTDVTLVGTTTGAVRGSVVFGSINSSLTFIKTGPTAPGATTGILEPDTYTLTLRSDSTGFVDSLGNLLRDAGGMAQGDFISTFTVAARPANDVILSIPDFARGFSQAVNVPNTSTGLPITISNAKSIAGVDVTISYNPALLTITGASTPISGASATVTFPSSGTVRIQVDSANAFATVDGAATIFTLDATVPSTAAYTSKEIISFTNTIVRNTDLSLVPSVADDAIHVAAFFADLNADQIYDSADTILVQRLGVGTNSGTTSYQTLDPYVIGDSLNDYWFDSADTVIVQRLGVGTTVASVPALPAGAGSGNVGVIDPRLFIPTNLMAIDVNPALDGIQIDIPVNVEVTDINGVTMSGIDIAIAFDPTKLSVNTRGATRIGDLLSESGNNLVSDPFGVVYTVSNGILRIQASSGTGTNLLAYGTSGTLITIRATVAASATGSTVLNLLGNAGGTWTGIRDNSIESLLLVPAPTNSANDSVDGLLTIPDARGAIQRAKPQSITLDSNVKTEQVLKDILLTYNSVPANSNADTLIGKLSSTGFESKKVTYSFVSGAGSQDNAKFKIMNDELQLANSNSNVPAKSSYVVRLRATDLRGISIDKIFGIDLSL